MNRIKLSSLEQLSLWVVAATCLLPLLPFAVSSLGS